MAEPFIINENESLGMACCLFTQGNQWTCTPGEFHDLSGKPSKCNSWKWLHALRISVSLRRERGEEKRARFSIYHGKS